MIEYLLRMFGISLLLTLLIELTVAYFMRVVSKRNRILIILTNILTNPAAVLIVWTARQHMEYNLAFAVEVLVEIIVVVIEAKIYLEFAEKEHWKIEHPIRLAVVANGVSWITGILLLFYKEVV